MSPHKVVIPVDGSMLSRQILPQVERLLKPSEHELILLRVAAHPTGIVGAPPRPVAIGWSEPLYVSSQDAELARHPTYASQTIDNIRSEVEQELFSEIHHLQQLGFTVSLSVCFGDPAEAIADFVEQEGADMVAMATHGRSGLPRLLMGSVADELLHRLSVPMMVLNQGAGGAERN